MSETESDQEYGLSIGAPPAVSEKGGLTSSCLFTADLVSSVKTEGDLEEFKPEETLKPSIGMPEEGLEQDKSKGHGLDNGQLSDCKTEGGGRIVDSADASESLQCSGEGNTTQCLQAYSSLEFVGMIENLEYSNMDDKEPVVKNEVSCGDSWTSLKDEEMEKTHGIKEEGSLEFNSLVKKAESLNDDITVKKEGNMPFLQTFDSVQTDEHSQSIQNHGEVEYSYDQSQVIGQVFEFPTGLKQESIDQPSDKKLYNCQSCAMAFGHQHVLLLHKKFCAKNPKIEENLVSSELIRNVVTRKKKRLYKCHHCGKTFNLKSDCTKHERIHTGEKPYKCQHCDKTFAQKSQQTVHERLHTGEKPYKCEHCEKTFARKNHCLVHQMTHTGERPYKCGHCEKTFLTKQNLLSHERVHRREKPFKCQYCDKAYAHKNICTVHEKSHTGEMPHKCQFCEKHFARKINCTKHEKIHTGDRPYKCEHCEKTFISKHHLLMHERVHTEERPLKCQYCQKTSSTKQSLKRHENTHTRKKTAVD